MLPVIALIGRPNVGKSTLFNRLTRSRDALVADQPGLTRDRKYGKGMVGDRPYVLVDTGGITDERDRIDELMARQVDLAIGESDHLLFMVDARQGCTAADEIIADRLRRANLPITLVMNKVDGQDATMAASEFHRLGLGDPHPIAAVHGRGVNRLVSEMLVNLPKEEDSDEGKKGIHFAVIGRPNVGKSTLVNRMLGEERVLAFDAPGTTRDSIHIPMERDGKAYTVIDTAGIRRRAKVSDTIEKFSVIKAMQAMEQANVVLLVLDARQGVSEQDANLAGHVLESGRALILVVNKWDGLTPDQRQWMQREIERKLPFLNFAKHKTISALHGTGVGELFELIDSAYSNAIRELATPRINQLLEMIVSEHPPPLVHGRRIKLRYAHQGGKNPPLIVIHGNQTEHLPDAYKRFLIGRFRKALNMGGTPIRLEFRSGENPYAGKRNKLTPRQIEKRKRLKRHVMKKTR